MALYPFKFRPQLLDKIWGGHTIAGWYDHVPAGYENVGEAWVMSDFDTYPTEVANGSHAGDTLHDLLEVYMDELVGEKVYDVFGNHFPLLMKFIDAADDLSIQVHPNDDYALENEQSLGKTEMWYVLPSPEGASIFLDWNQPIDASIVKATIKDGTLAQYLCEHKVQNGDVAFIPAGTVHAMRRNTIVAEIQENSDLTYRLYDYNRVGADGSLRPLHLDKALTVSNFEPSKENLFTHPKPVKDGVVNLRKTSYFTTNLLYATHPLQRDYAPLDSFVAYMCVKGECGVKALDGDAEQEMVLCRQGEAILIPATLNDILIEPQTDECQLLEIYLEI